MILYGLGILTGLVASIGIFVRRLHRDALAIEAERAWNEGA